MKSDTVHSSLVSTIQKLTAPNEKKQQINDLWDLIKSTICSAESMCTEQSPPPNHCKRRKPSYYQKWFDKECAQARAELGNARQYSKQNPYSLDHYLKLDKDYTKLCRFKKENLRNNCQTN
eukprot:Lithocolla_globosa_v1_NODE_12513_length_428_cov_25.865952.p1 type:complete len:121 gc:universal NODE_12513_length_428_cov_25.865952:428-66(-)